MFSPLDEKIAAYIIEKGWLSSARVKIIMHDLFEKKKQEDELNILDLIDRRKLLSASQLTSLEAVQKEFVESEKRKQALLEQVENDEKHKTDEIGELTKAQAIFEQSTSTVGDPFVGSVFGNCKLEKLLGKGGMGSVYLATHLVLMQTRAVKILPPNFSIRPEFAERFIQEARTAARLEHPNIVQVFDVGKDYEYFYIVMQYVDGGSLTNLLYNRTKIDVKLALHLTLEVAKGLSAAHKLGIVHRDIKPDNILLSKDGEVRIADFGLAKDASIDLELTKAGEVFGSPAYMSPEQCTGEKLDARSDLYSLGITFYQMLTGKRPFTAPTTIAVMLMHQSEKPKPVNEHVPEIPEYVNKIVLKLLEKSPDNRFQSADELIEALKNAQKDFETGSVPTILKKTYDKNLFCILALQHNFIGADQVSELLEVSEQNQNADISEIAISKGYITSVDVTKILDILKKTSAKLTNVNSKTQLDKILSQSHANIAESAISQEKGEEIVAKQKLTNIFDTSKEFISKKQFIELINLLDEYIANYGKFKLVEKAIEFRDKIVAEAPPKLIKLAEQAVNKNKLDAALDYLNTVINLAPNSEQAYNHRGLVYTKRSEFNRALANFDKAIELNPNIAIVYLNRGNLYRRIDKIDAAFSDYSTALKLDPQMDRAFCNRGGIYLSRKDLDNALKDFDQAIEVNSRNEEARNGRAQILLRMGRQQDALRELDKLCAKSPNNSHAYNSRGEILLNMDQAEEAELDFKHAASVDENFADPLYNMSIISAIAGDASTSVTFLRKAFRKGFKKIRRFKSEQRFDKIRDTYEFQELLKALNLG